MPLEVAEAEAEGMEVAGERSTRKVLVRSDCG
jgi:hypothetical protein